MVDGQPVILIIHSRFIATEIALPIAPNLHGQHLRPPLVELRVESVGKRKIPCYSARGSPSAVPAAAALLAVIRTQSPVGKMVRDLKARPKIELN